MLTLSLAKPSRRHLRVLCLGAHADDIEIGCGGTVLRLLATHPASRIHWVVLSATDTRREEAQVSAARFLRGARRSEVSVESFRDGHFPSERAALKEYFADLAGRGAPDLILTHHEADLHQDHALVARLTRETFRNHFTLGYEIPKVDGDLGAPNVYVPLDAATRRRKTRILMGAFASQRRKRWFTEDTFNGLMRLRGIESGARAGYAEAFYGRKIVMF